MVGWEDSIRHLLAWGTRSRLVDCGDCDIEEGEDNPEDEYVCCGGVVSAVSMHGPSATTESHKQNSAHHQRLQSDTAARGEARRQDQSALAWMDERAQWGRRVR